MRNVLSVLAIALVSSVPVLAQQTAPPPATTSPRPTPATAPTTPPPTNVRPPSVSPRSANVQGARTVPSVAPPSVGFALSEVAPQAAQGQTPRPGQNTPAAPAASTVAQATSWQNVKLEVAISDSLTADVQTKKTVSMLIMDGRNGQVRSSNEGYINIDASPSIRPDGRIYLRLTVEYLPYLTAQQSQQTGNTVGRTNFSESLSVVVSDGKPITLSQAADPRGDRKVSLEVTASVIK